MIQFEDLKYDQQVYLDCASEKGVVVLRPHNIDMNNISWVSKFEYDLYNLVKEKVKSKKVFNQTFGDIEAFLNCNRLFIVECDPTKKIDCSFLESALEISGIYIPKNHNDVIEGANRINRAIEKDKRNSTIGEQIDYSNLLKHIIEDEVAKKNISGGSPVCCPFCERQPETKYHHVDERGEVCCHGNGHSLYVSGKTVSDAVKNWNLKFGKFNLKKD